MSFGAHFAIARALPYAAARLRGRRKRMREIVRTNDAVLVSAVGALLDGAQIRHMVLDQNMSVLEGSLGILPRRVLVAEDDVIRARRLLTEAGLAHELRPDGR
jgi:Putative prokaryotic signal transducing protein